ncbi:MAG: hypothetical protein RR939_12110, partial [Acinetobacter sp.]
SHAKNLIFNTYCFLNYLNLYLRRDVALFERPVLFGYWIITNYRLGNSFTGIKENKKRSFH